MIRIFIYYMPIVISVIVYKNQKLIHKKKLNYKYYNIELDSIYYNEK